jgi:hypothetical protein
MCWYEKGTVAIAVEAENSILVLRIKMGLLSNVHNVGHTMSTTLDRRILPALIPWLGDR